MRYLDNPTRERVFPVLSVRPWPNTSEFGKLLPKLGEATAGFRHGIDIDRHKFGVITREPCASQFYELFDRTHGFAKFYDFVAQDPDRVPVLRDCAGLYTNLNDQIEHINSLHRGVIVRLQRGYSDDVMPILNSGLFVAEDTLFIVDAGWSTDVIGQEFWASGLINQITEWDQSAEIVCSSSSFPNSFSHIDYRATFSIDDRDLYQRLVRRHNAANLVYGDWGSTRQSEEAGGGTHYDRIDTASAGEWISFRQTGDEVGYRVVARRVVEDRGWTDLPPCWGKHAIECTSLDIPGAIKGTEGAASSRINMHITAQANIEAELTLEDEPYLDSF